MADISSDTPAALVEDNSEGSVAADSRVLSTMLPRPPPSAGASVASNPRPPGSSASVPESVTSVVTATPTLGGSTQTQVNVVNREFTPRPSTSDKSQHQFYANIPPKRPGTTENDNESIVSRSTAHRTNMSSTGGRRPPSRSHIPAIMPAYSFYHPLRPPAVANASGQQEIPQTTKTMEDEQLKLPENQAKPSDELRPATSQRSLEFSSVHGKPSTEPLLPPPAAVKPGINQLHPVVEGSSASNRTSMLSAQLLRTTPPAQNPSEPAKNGVKHITTKATTRNWQHFPGKTRYHLGGRVQFGTQYLANIGTGVLILIPVGLYFTFTYIFLFPLVDVLVVDISGQNFPPAYPYHSHT